MGSELVSHASEIQNNDEDVWCGWWGSVMARISDAELAQAWYSNDNIQDLELLFDMNRNAIHARWSLLKNKGMLPSSVRAFPKPVLSTRLRERPVSYAHTSREGFGVKYSKRRDQMFVERLKKYGHAYAD